MAKQKGAKKFYESKTFWINVLVLVIGILTGLQDQLLTGTAITLTAIINIILRSITKNAVKWNLTE